MSSPRPLEWDYLSDIEKSLQKIITPLGNSHEVRLQVLETIASYFGGFDIENFHKKFNIKHLSFSAETTELIKELKRLIEISPVEYPLILSILSREDLLEHNRKTTGAYHTDFRLAQRLARALIEKITPNDKIIDPACGAGILLTAVALEFHKKTPNMISSWLKNSVFAADLSANSLRGTVLSLASLTDDVDALINMRNKWFCGDSLLAEDEIWTGMCPNGFDAVIGNPPWEKVKISKHEYLKANGVERSYGQNIEQLDETDFHNKKIEVSGYSKLLSKKYPILGCGDPDLYIAFMDLSFRLCRNHGHVSILIPGGFIRSQGTQTIRQTILSSSESTTISIFDNKSRFFSIDTRFKFLLVELTKNPNIVKTNSIIKLTHEQGAEYNTYLISESDIPLHELEKVRRDLSIPEVKNIESWNLFNKLFSNSCSWEDENYGWSPKFCREIDMTKDKRLFYKDKHIHSLPLIEGRMVNAHRLGVKGYVKGDGRSAVWESYDIGEEKLQPQFFLRIEDLPHSIVERSMQYRVGFCDIAGQTNEHSLTYAIIPPGVICGNKVPTITFPHDTSLERLIVWTAISNSFVFDWMLRRVLTTTVNYFLLQSIPLPKLKKSSEEWNLLVDLISKIRNLLEKGNLTDENKFQIALLRAEIDAEIAMAFNLNLDEMKLILDDFQLLDRGQSPINNEKRSTVTTDLVMNQLAKKLKLDNSFWEKRVKQAFNLGAVGYIPSQLAMSNLRVSK